MSEPGNQPDPGNQLGKRYRCADCGLELLCLVAGSGRFTCHGSAMQPVSIEPLPSSD